MFNGAILSSDVCATKSTEIRASKFGQFKILCSVTIVSLIEILGSFLLISEIHLLAAFPSLP